MYAWKKIEQSLTLIEEHLAEEISTEELADTVGLSPFYYQRLFKRLVRKPVQEYVKLRRLAKVIENLKDTNRRILDIALDYGFSSHANFTRVFKEAYGMTPDQYRKDLPMLNTFDRPQVSMNYVLVDEGVPLVVGEIVLEIQRRTLEQPEVYLGFETEVRISEQMPLGENTGIDVPGQLWKRYHREQKLLAAILNTEVELGIAYMGDSAQGCFNYFAGGLARKIPEQLPEGFKQQELAAGEYIVCNIEAESFEELVTVALSQANKYLFSTWLPRHNVTTEPFAAEKYYRDTGDMASMEIWVKPIAVTSGSSVLCSHSHAAAKDY